MGVVSKDRVSINLTQCQLPREACTEKALVTGCQGTVWDHTMSLICSLTRERESRDVLDSDFGRWTDSQLLKQSLKMDIQEYLKLVKQLPMQAPLNKSSIKVEKVLSKTLLRHISMQNNTRWSIRMQIGCVEGQYHK